MPKVEQLLPDSVAFMSAIPPDVAGASTGSDRTKWCEFIEKHAIPLRSDLQKCITDSMVDPDTGVYRKRTPISGSLVTQHWSELDFRHAFAEILRHQLADTVLSELPAEAASQYDKMRGNFRASVRVFWEQASWVALHLGTERELDFPYAEAAEGYFDIVDSQLAELFFERAFSQMCTDESDPHHAALKVIYEARFGKPLDCKKLASLDNTLSKLTPQYVKTCTDFWKLGGYKE